MRRGVQLAAAHQMKAPQVVYRVQIGAERAVLQAAIPHLLTTGKLNASASSSKNSSASGESLRNVGGGSAKHRKRLGGSSSSRTSRKP